MGRMGRASMGRMGSMGSMRIAEYSEYEEDGVGSISRMIHAFIIFTFLNYKIRTNRSFVY